MVRIYHIADPLLREKVVAKLAKWRGTTPAGIPDWFELDDGDYSELLIELRAEDEGRRADGDYD